MPGVVKLPHSILEASQVLHSVPVAAGVNHHLPIFANTKGSVGNVESIPFIDIPLQRAQVGLTAIQLNDPTQLC
jgi:hypothetical protein